jgi:hypothetical protein
MFSRSGNYLLKALKLRGTLWQGNNAGTKYMPVKRICGKGKETGICH